VVAALHQFVGDTPQVPVYPLRILQLGIGRKSGFNAPVILLGGGVFGIGGMEGDLVMVEHVGLASSAVRVNFRSAFRTMSEKKLPDEPAAAEGSQEAALGWP